MSEVKTNTIGKEFTYKELIKFVAAPVVSQLFVSLLQTLDDSLFLSRYCGQNALAAFSVAMPWFMFVDAFGMVLAQTSVKCSILMGEKKNEEANDSFTTMILVAFIFGVIFSLVLTLFRKEILLFLGETEALLPYALTYMDVSRFYTPMVLMAYIFCRFYTVSGKPKWNVAHTIINTFCNFFFDWLFIVKMNMGIIGTAYANLIGRIVTTIIAFVFFSNKKQEVHFTKFVKDPFRLIKEVISLGKTNGLTSLSISLNGFINNRILLGIGGEAVVAAYTIVNNVQFMFMNAYFGLLGATSPLISYAYGERNVNKLRRILKQVLVLVIGQATITMTLFIIGRNPIMRLYLPDDSNLEMVEMVRYGMKIVPFLYYPFGFNVFVQEVAMDVGNTKVSTILSIIENVIFANLVTIALPKIFGIDGVWYCFIVSELLTIVFSLYAVYTNRNNYGYGKDKIAAFIDQK